MYIDNNLILSDAQSVTTTATSTYYIDMLSTGFGHNDELYAQFLVDTAFTITSGASITVALMVANETTFSSTSVVAMKTILWNSTTASADYMLANMKIGPDIYKPGSISGTNSPFRYLYATYTPVGGVVASGKFNARLVKDIDMGLDTNR